MRLLKAQNTNLRNIYGDGVKYDINGQVIMDSTNVLLVPKGTDAEFVSTPTNGHIRYNTDTNELEVYQDNAWRKLRFKEPNRNPGITQQNLGSGDYNEIYFGPLDSGDSDYPVPAAGQNILVFVENVFQIHNTNYELEQNPGRRREISNIISTGATTVIETSSAHGYTVDDLIYVSGVESDIDDALENINTDDSGSPYSHTIVSIPSSTRIEIGVDTSGGNTANYTSGTGFILRAGSVTGPYLPGTYIKFFSAVDLDKPVTVLHNFDK